MAEENQFDTIGSLEKKICWEPQNADKRIKNAIKKNKRELAAVSSSFNRHGTLITGP